VHSATSDAAGRSLYYHRLDGERYTIYRVTRPWA
jgi:hypothetical protein